MWAWLGRTVVSQGGRLFGKRMGKGTFSALGSRLKGVFSTTGRVSKTSIGSTLSKARSYVAKSPFIAKAKNYIKPIYDKTPNWVKSIIGMVAIDQALDYGLSLMTDDAGEGVPAEDAKLIADAMSFKNGTHVLKSLDGGEGDSRISSSDHYACASLINDMYLSKQVVLGQDLSEQMTVVLDGLSDQQRIHMISILTNITKRLAISSERPGIINSFRVQSAVSGELIAYPTLALSDILSNRNNTSLDICDAISGEVGGLFSTLLQDVRDESAQDFFDANTEYFSGTFDPNLKETNPFFSTILAVDEPLSDSLGWWSKFKIDEDDPTDDETIVSALLDKYSSLSDYYADYLSKLSQNRLGFSNDPQV